MSLNEEKKKEILKKFGMHAEYTQIKREIDPLITRIIKVTGKDKPEYLQLKKNAVEWLDRFKKTLKVGRKVSSLRKSQISVKEPQLLAFLKMFQYLGQVESIGTDIIDMLVLLLVADGHTYHIEHRFKLPRITHAKDFHDLKDTTLRDKICFLEENGLKATSGIIDRGLRNLIAHLNFDVNKKGEIFIKGDGKLNIDERLSRFDNLFFVITLVLDESGFMDFLRRVMKDEQKSQSRT